MKDKKHKWEQTVRRSCGADFKVRAQPKIFNISDILERIHLQLPQQWFKRVLECWAMVAMSAL